MPKSRTPKPAAAPGYLSSAVAPSRQIATTGRVYHLSAQLRGAAEAQAIRARADALAANTNLVNLNAVERWDGKLPARSV